jgi:hypothetical protein
MQEKERDEKEEMRKRHPGKGELAGQVRRQAQENGEKREEGPIVRHIRLKWSLLVAVLSDPDIPVTVGGQNLLPEDMARRSARGDFRIHMAGKEVGRRLHPSNAQKDDEDYGARQNAVEEGCVHTPIAKEIAPDSFRGGGKWVLDFHAAGNWLSVRQNWRVRRLKALLSYRKSG